MNPNLLAFHPFAICAFICLGIVSWVVIRSKPDLPTLISSANNVGAQMTGITVLIIGCTMLVLCKMYDLDSTIAGGIVGCGINMLTNQFSKQHVDPTGKTTTDTSTIPGPTASEKPEVK